MAELVLAGIGFGAEMLISDIKDKENSKNGKIKGCGCESGLNAVTS